MIYLASPYFHPDAAVRESRFREACRAAARFMRRGQPIFSPVAHGHPIAKFGLPSDWGFWEPFDRHQLQQCREVVVLMLAGWRQSVGVQAEIRIATQLGKPVRFVSPEAIDEVDIVPGSVG